MEGYKIVVNRIILIIYANGLINLLVTNFMRTIANIEVKPDLLKMKNVIIRFKKFKEFAIVLFIH